MIGETAGLALLSYPLLEPGHQPHPAPFSLAERCRRRQMQQMSPFQGCASRLLRCWSRKLGRQRCEPPIGLIRLRCRRSARPSVPGVAVLGAGRFLDEVTRGMHAARPASS